MTQSTAVLQRVAVRWLLPGLVAAMIVGNEGWTIGPFTCGEILSWLNDAAAVIVVLGRFGDRRWPYVVLVCTVAAKLVTLAGISPARADLAFDTGLSLLFCAAGAVIVSLRPGIVYRELLVIAALSVPLMVVQMTGLAPWSEGLNTEHAEDVSRPSPTLFVHEADLHYRTAQARPSGFTHSNNFLSLLAAFTVILHFAKSSRPRLTWRDLLVITFALLTMAKIVLLLLAVAIGWKLLTGGVLERRRTLKVVGLVALVLMTYGVFFPGLLATNLDETKLAYSVFSRANDFAALLPEGTPMKEWLRERLAGTLTAGPHASPGLSGYAQIINLLPYVLVAVAAVAPLLWAGLLRVRRRYPAVLELTVLSAFFVVLYPTAVPLLRAQIFWFLAGFAALPAFLLWEPDRFRGTQAVRRVDSTAEAHA